MNEQVTHRARLGAALAIATLVVSAAAYAEERLNIVSEGKASKDWQVAPGTTPGVPAYPGIVADKGDRVCVGVGFRVQPDGSTANPAILKSWSAAHPEGEAHVDYIQPFARNAIAAVQQWKFVPVKKARPTYTAVTFTFGNESPEVRGHCQIDNLPAFIAKAQAEAFKRGNLRKGEQERERQREQVVVPQRY